ncbi:MAG: hypothetical protein J0H15_11670 [Xanthomonadales bacterium]|nr:hypothetical protein [Xanthomonadales bacterium]
MKPTSILIALPLGLVFATAAMAQRTPTQQTPTQQSPTTQQDQQRTQDMQMQQDRSARSDTTRQHDQQNPAARSAAGNEQARSAHPTFDQLDGKSQGYLTRSDVSRDTWMTSHFAQCDTNGDSQISRTEYQACRR